MNKDFEEKNKQAGKLQEDRNNPDFAKSPTGFPEEPRATNKDQQQTPGSNPEKDPGKDPQPMKAPGKTEGLRNEEGESDDDSNNPTRKQGQSSSTTPDPTDPEGPKPGKHTDDRDGQQEKETEMPETPPSEWEIKGEKDKPSDGKQPNNNDLTQNKPHRGL
jgi:hypothetical protein